jgi:long-chain acyl-CoA synthetase
MRVLADLLRKGLAEAPEKPALVHGDRVVSYRELAAQSARVAGALEARHGGRPGRRVAILLRNGPEFLFAYFGAAASGHVAVPVNYHLQPDEIAFLLDNAGCSCLLTTAEFLPKVRAVAGRLPALRTVVCAGATEAWPAALPWERFVEGRPDAYEPGAPVRPEDVAVFLYTSGSTGSPKAAMLSHANLLSNVATEAELYGLGRDDVFGCVLPMFHNYALLDTCLLPLCLGATIAVGDHEDTEGVLGLIERRRVTFLAAMPAQLGEMACRDFARRYDTASLRMVQTGGAPLSTEVQRKFRARYGLDILEGYGCSEASSTVTVMPVGGPVRPQSVGKPMPNQRVRVVDEDGRDVPAGQEGEVVVRGPNVFRGYHGQPEETRRALRDGWLHTGDLGRFDADGYLYITGRIKSMINVGGLKVCPAEVEEVLQQVEGVAGACVVATYHPELGEAVKAFVEPVPGRRPEVERLLRHCEARLGGYKVPRSIEVRAALPRTGTGKVAAKALQDEERARAWPPAA